MAIDDWFWEWKIRHESRFPRGDWPATDAEFWQTLRHLFVTGGVTEDVAEEASKALFLEPPQYPDDFPLAIMAKARGIFRARQARATPAHPDAEAAKREAESVAWNRAAFASWEQTPEEDREYWRKLARQRAPFFRGEATELLAVAWHHEPSSVIPVPPPRAEVASPSKRGPRRLFDPVEKV